jgi:alpha-tubulin suppressor-like RCC1 family protein
MSGFHDLSDLDGEYELLAELGRGGSAVVYRARDRLLGRDGAIKVVRGRGGVVDEEQIARLAREARMVAQLEHPLIVRVHAVRPIADGLALVMQWVPGQTLKQRIAEEGPLPIAEAESVLHDIATALAFAHQHGVIHRDVKPENIFLDVQHRRALLSDFGIAHSREFESRLTMDGTAIGTPAYMAPEQIDGATADARSDVYSLGLVAWEMLTGRQPWDGETLYNVIYHQKHDALPSMDTLRDGIPERLQYIVERAMQKRPAARWAGAEGMLAQLDGSVLPPDWRQWRAAHAKRRTLRAVPASGRRAGVLAVAMETIRFRRGDAPAQASSPETAAATAESARDIATDAPDDAGSDAPDWVTSTAPSHRRWALVACAAAVTLVGVLTWAARDRDNARRVDAPPATVVASEGSRRMAVPVVVPPETVATRATSPVAASATARDSASGRVATVDSNGGTLGTGAMAPKAWPRSVDAVPLDRRRPPDTLVLADDSLAAAVTVPLRPRANGRGAASVRDTDDEATIAAGGRHSCVVRGPIVRCWGGNDDGQLGTGTYDGASQPARVLGELALVRLTAGVSHSCGLTRGGDAYCWGNDDAGQLGDATTTTRDAPVRVAANMSFSRIRAGRAHTCALTDAGVVACWGANSSGQLGDGSTTSHATPTIVASPLRFVAIAAGWQHSCAIARDGTAWCWGENSDGQLGDGRTTRRATPTAVQGGLRFTSIAAGSAHTCAVSVDGDVWCWGRNTAGQLGAVTSDGVRSPIPVHVTGITGMRAVVAGSVHSCARSATGMAWCWGRNNYGQLGDGSTVDRRTPVPVRGGLVFTSLSATGAHSCGVRASGEVWCWGFNADGQLGDGTTEHQSRPIRVSGSAP